MLLPAHMETLCRYIFVSDDLMVYMERGALNENIKKKNIFRLKRLSRNNFYTSAFVCTFAFFVSSLRVSRKGKWEKRRLTTKIAASALTIAVKFRRAVTCTANLVSRAWLTQFREMMQRRGSVTAFATHDTVGNSPLPRLTIPLLGQYARRRERGRRCDIAQENALRYRKRRVTFTGARVFLENTFLPRGFGTRGRRKCQPPLYRYTPALIPPWISDLTDSFGAIRRDYVGSAFCYHYHSFWYAYSLLSIFIVTCVSRIK